MQTTQSVSVEKLEYFKNLAEIAKNIIKRPEYIMVGKTKMRTEKALQNRQTDSKFLSVALFNSNPIYKFNVGRDKKTGKITKIYLETDLNLKTENLEQRVNEIVANFKGKDEIDLYELVIVFINSIIHESYEDQGVFINDSDYVKYLETLNTYQEVVHEAIYCIKDFPGIIKFRRIIDNNIILTGFIKNKIDKSALEGAVWK